MLFDGVLPMLDALKARGHLTGRARRASPGAA